PTDPADPAPRASRRRPAPTRTTRPRRPRVRQPRPASLCGWLAILHTPQASRGTRPHPLRPIATHGTRRGHWECRRTRSQRAWLDPQAPQTQRAGRSPLPAGSSDGRADYSVTPSPSSTALIDRRIRPCLSTSSTLTLTTSPSLSLSETFSTRSLEICETWTRPSLPGR